MHLPPVGLVLLHLLHHLVAPAELIQQDALRRLRDVVPTKTRFYIGFVHLLGLLTSRKSRCSLGNPWKFDDFPAESRRLLASRPILGGVTELKLARADVEFIAGKAGVITGMRCCLRPVSSEHDIYKCTIISFS